jgi:hypothetical protein
MRCIVTGIDGDGNSCVVEDREIAEVVGAFDRQDLALLSLVDLPTRPPGRGDTHELGIPLGNLRWSVTQWPPFHEWPSMHHTDTIDLNHVVAGTLTLRLDDGEHLLNQGDFAIVRGVDHAWATGPAGCTLTLIMITTPPLEDSTS